MRPYYEGWYMKQQQGGDILAVIPGRAQDEAFIQVVTADGAHYLPFPLEDFRQTGTRSMRVGRSLFSPIGMMLDVQAPGLELVGACATASSRRCAPTSWDRSPTCPWKRSTRCSACATAWTGKWS